MRTITEERREIPVSKEVDVVVAGGGPAGIGTALAAARMGAKTLLVEQFGALGGVATTGLHTHVCTLKDAGAKNLIVGGISKELSDRLVELNTATLGAHLDFELESMKRELDAMMLESGVELLYYTLVSDTIVSDDSIEGIIVENKSGRSAILSKMVVDCTGDADVAARAGAPFEKGRESDGGMQPVTLMFRIGGVDWSMLREYRLSDPKLEEMCRKAIRAGDMEPFQTRLMGFWFCHIRPDQVGVNFTNITGIDSTNADDLTRATIEGRKQAKTLMEVLRKYVPGFEDGYIIDTAAVIGIRESRRIIGEYVMTVDDVVNVKKFPDGIAKGSFFVDIHHPTDTGLHNPRYLGQGTHYDIPYRCIVPRRIDDLLVAGRCISVTHEALGSTRVMFQCMALGEAAGTAAALCISQGVIPRKLDAQLLRKELAARGGIA
ncbi:FAD-dependent oxidoreductase [Candidatus Poribacteria bacterium]